MSVTDQRPGRGDTPTPAPHAPWCSPAEHIRDESEHTESCASAPLRLDFDRHTDADDAVRWAVFSLTRDPAGRTALNAAGPDFSLDPRRIRPFAMALLALDALANAGDLDAYAYYRSQAEASASVKP